MPLEKFGEVGGCHVTCGPALSGRLIRQASQYGPDTACQLGVQLISLVLRHLHGTQRTGNVPREIPNGLGTRSRLDRGVRPTDVKLAPGAPHHFDGPVVIQGKRATHLRYRVRR